MNPSTQRMVYLSQQSIEDLKKLIEIKEDDNNDKRVKYLPLHELREALRKRITVPDFTSSEKRRISENRRKAEEEASRQREKAEQNKAIEPKPTVGSLQKKILLNQLLIDKPIPPITLEELNIKRDKRYKLTQRQSLKNIGRRSSLFHANKNPNRRSSSRSRSSSRNITNRILPPDKSYKRRRTMKGGTKYRHRQRRRHRRRPRHV